MFIAREVTPSFFMRLSAGSGNGTGTSAHQQDILPSLQYPWQELVDK
jgi:hypothetical protein